MKTIFNKKRWLLDQKQNFEIFIEPKPGNFRKSKWRIIYISLLVTVSISTIAQPTDGSVTFTPTSTSGFVTGIFYVSLPDSTSWSAIEIHLKDQIEDSVLFSREYAFDQTTGLPAGISWERNGTDVYLGTGTLPVRLGWQGRARLKNNSNTWSEYLEFIFQ